MMEALVRFWLMLCHWIEFDKMEDAAAAKEAAEDLAELKIQVKLRERRAANGAVEYVIYVKDADRDLARYYTGWRF